MRLRQLRLDTGRGGQAGHQRSVFENQGRRAVDTPLLTERKIAGDGVLARRLIGLTARMQVIAPRRNQARRSLFVVRFGVRIERRAGETVTRKVLIFGPRGRPIRLTPDGFRYAGCVRVQLREGEREDIDRNVLELGEFAIEPTARYEYTSREKIGGTTRNGTAHIASVCDSCERDSRRTRPGTASRPISSQHSTSSPIPA